MSIQKILIFLLLTTFSNQIFSAEVKKDQQEEKKQSEETAEKESAKRFYHKYESNIDIKNEKLVFLEGLYYLIKKNNADLISSSFASDKEYSFLHPNRKLIISIILKEMSNNQWNTIVAVIGGARNPGSRTTPLWGSDLYDTLMKKVTEEDPIFIKELYSLIYQDIKSKNPNLPKIVKGDDAGKEFPKPEELNLPFHFWQKLDPEELKIAYPHDSIKLER